MSNKETPITKYLATLERRQARMGSMFGSSPSPEPSPDSRNPLSIRQRLRFEDETFLQPHNHNNHHQHDHSLMMMGSSFSHHPRNGSPHLLTTPTLIGSSTGSTSRKLPHFSTSKFGSSGDSGGGGRLGLGMMMGMTTTTNRQSGMTTGNNLNLLSSGGVNYRALIEKQDEGTTGGDQNKTGGGGVKRKRFSFENSFKEDEETAKKMGELERLLRQTQADLVEARALTTKLEQQKMELNRNHAEKIIQFEKSHNEMRIKSRDAIETAEELKKRMEKKTKEWEEKNEKHHRESIDRAEKVAVLENRVMKLESDNLKLKEQLDGERLNQSDSLNKTSADLEETEKGAEKWIMDCQILQEKLELKEKQVAKYQEELKEVQSIICKQQEVVRKPANDEVGVSADSEVERLREKITGLENMFAKQQLENNRLTQTIARVSEENSYMKSSIKKEMLLEEQITTLENEVKLLRDLLSKKVDVEATRDSYKEKLLGWTSIAAKIDQECSTPQKLESIVRQTQNNLLELKHENANMNCTITNTNTALKQCQTELANLREQDKIVIEERDKLAAELKQVSRKVFLLTKDRDGLKSLKESYEQELENVISAALRIRIGQLEELVQEYEKIINEDPSAKRSCRECEMRIKLISELKNELEKLRGDQATSQHGSTSVDGSGNTTGVKIVTFGMNPSSLSLEARVQELVTENERLAQKLKQFEEQSIAGFSDTNLLEEKKKLEMQLKTLERKHQILTDDYNFETQQLQIALNKLHGFHVTLVREPQSQFRLQSVYSQSADDVFIFQEAENSDMMLLETPILNHFREDINRYLLTEGSIPAFLATVTISLAQGNVPQQSTSAVANASELPSSQQSTGDSAEDETVTVEPSQRPSQRRTVQVEIEGESDREDSEEEMDEEDEEEEQAEEEEEYDEDNEDAYSQSEGSENEDDDDEAYRGRGRDRPAADSDSDDVVCID